MNQDIRNKKIKMFTEGQTAQWGIDIKSVGLPLNEIIKHKDIAIHYMLPSVILP
jgi:hypothetical protein